MSISRIVFAGPDANGNANLGVTTRTSAGTSELAVAGVNAGGLFNLDFFPSGFSPGFTVLGNLALFEGDDASGADSLWVTNGTTTATSELSVTHSYARGLFTNVIAPHLTAFAGKALFVGEDASGDITLWTTDGTGAGTSELAAPGGYANGLFYNVAAPDFTILDGKVLFQGEDASGKPNLWVTDGTSTGISELAVAGSFANGVFFDVSAPDLIVFAGKALFVGEDTSGNIGLWTTDATSTGTSELTVAESYANGLFYNLTAPDFTVLGNKVLFAGQDATGNSGLWVTDGTARGTSELAVAGANAGGLFDLHYFSANFSPVFTVLGNLGLFEGYDANGVDGLWVTDGTAAGTRELSVSGSYANGLFANVAAADFTVIGSTVLFAGKDASGNVNLWITNGTSAGTSELTGVGASSGGLSPTDFVGLPTAAGGPTSDFDGDGTSDILWQNTNGQPAAWLLNNTVPFNESAAGGNPGPSWHIAGTGDFNGDGKSDILWQNTNGQAAIWLMNGPTPISESVIGNPGPSWHIVGTGDFSGDGDADILWQNTNGQAAIWLMNGTTPVSEVTVGANPGPGWQIAGTGDYNGDGKSDILWQNTNGQAAVWLMNGTTPTFEGLVGTNPDPAWHIHAAS